MRTRKDILDLERDPNDSTIDWYARAIGEMQSRPITDNTSWRWQAAVHGYRPGSDPLAKPGEAMPSSAEQRRYWRQCQHRTWYFLPWHRLYLHVFEEIVAATIATLGGPRDWALPYWNYSDGRASRILPASLRRPTLSNGSPNPLRVAARASQIQGGQPLSQQNVELSALREPEFTPPGFRTGFGGGRTGLNHLGGRMVGALENIPHNVIHGNIGGASGWMSDPNTAALDPVFWLHHSNIDRLWEVWIQRDQNHANPTDRNWLRLYEFEFLDAGGQSVKFRCNDALTTTGLGYQYDDVNDPLPVTFGAGGPPTGPLPPGAMPHLITASHHAVSIASNGAMSVSTLRASKTESADGVETFGLKNQVERVYLQLDNVTGEANAEAVDVYIGIPPGENPEAHEDKLVGRFGLFGLVESSQRDSDHSGEGLSFAVDVTKQIRSIPLGAGSEEHEIPVSIRVVGEDCGSPVRVGRISLYAETE